MKMLVESLKRMYKKGTLTKEQISERVAKGSISADEYEYIKPKINVKKLKRIVSKHSRKENEQHDRLEKGDRNTAGTSGGNRQDIVSVNGLSA